MSDGLLLQNGDDLLLESGDRLLLQEGGAPVTSGDVSWSLHLLTDWECELTTKWDVRAVAPKWQIGAPAL